MLKNYLWILPFLFFLLGYYLISTLTAVHELKVPPLVGLHVTQAVKVLSDNNLNIRIMAEKEEPDLDPGTVLSQTPSPYQKVKHQHPIFLVISKKPQPLVAPSLVAKNHEDTSALLHEHGIRAKIYTLETSYPQGICIGQLPSANEPIANKKMILYESAGTNKSVLFPDLIDATVTDVKELFHNSPVTLKISHRSPLPEHECVTCRVVDHKPLAGSLIDSKKPLYIQLFVD